MIPVVLFFYLIKACSSCPCTFAEFADGVCHEGCNNSDCMYDGGDCDCSSGCNIDMRGNGVCESACDNSSCSYDDGDCANCGDNCSTSSLGNGICDASCNYSDCSYDDGDCCGTGCSVSSIGDGNCDVACNVVDCMYDGGDCDCAVGCSASSLGDGNCDDACNNSDCNFDDDDCYCAPGCALEMVGDGNCDDECYTVDCTYDSSDCCALGCASTSVGDGVCDDACKVSSCTYDGGDCDCAVGCSPPDVGDGVCDDACNNSDCNYDDTDCDCSLGCSPPSVGDGICDDACYTADCGYDSGDCCALGCPSSSVGDGICNMACATSDCSYDGGDCDCAADCPLSSMGDGICDSGCNSSECNCDDGDCGIPDGCLVDNCDDEVFNIDCAECTEGSANSCTVCNLEFSLTHIQTCSEDLCSDDVHNPNCVECTEGQSNTCVLCNYGTLLSSESTCVEDTCTDIADCLTCEDPLVCTVCGSGTEYAQDNTCIEDTCTSDDPYCLTCSSPEVCTLCVLHFGLDGDVCVRESCPETQYVDGMDCGDCETLCRVCTNPSECTECMDYTYTIDASCFCVEYSSYGSNSCMCDEGTLGDIEGIACVPLGDYLPASAYTAVAFTSSDCDQFELSFNTAVTVVDASETDCESLFEPTTVHILGNDPSCSWSDDKRTLTVDLSDSYDFTSTTVNIEVNWRHVRQSSDEVDRNYELLYRTISKTQCPSPVPTLSAPSTSSSACIDSSIELLAATPVGFGNSPVVYAWSVTPALADLSSLEGNKISVSVPSDSVGDYLFTVTATNAFAKTGTASATVTLSDSAVLTLSFDTSSAVTIEANQGLTVKPSVTTDCEVSGSRRYDWTYQGTVSGNEATIPSRFETSQSKLKVKPNDLKAGDGYIFGCTVTQSGYESYEELTITVEYSDLIPRLNLGDQDISSGVDLELDATESEDPDGEVLYFVWSCVYAGSGSVCLNSEGSFLISETTPLTTAQTLTVSSENLTVDDVLEITVTISTEDGREQSKTVTLTVKDAGESSITIVPIEIEKILVHRPFVITLFLLGTQVRWEQVSGPTLTSSSAADLPSIRFGSYSMEEGVEYKFRAVLSTSGTAQIALEIAWLTNKRPLCFDSLSSSPVGDIFYELSILNCMDGDEEDYPLVYAFGAEIFGYHIPLSYPTSYNAIIVYLFPVQYSLSVTVCDALGSCTTDELFVTIGRRRRLESDNDNLQEDYSDAYSDEDQVPMLVKMFAESYNYTQADWDFLYAEIEDYATSILSEDSEYDLIVATGIVGAVLELLEKLSPALSEEQVIRGLAIIDTVIDNATEQFETDFVDVIIEVLGSLDTSGSVFTAMLATSSRLNRLMIENQLPGESVTFSASENSAFTGLYRGTHSNTVSFATMDGTFELVYANLTSSDTDIIDVEVLVFPGADASSSPVIDILCYNSGKYDPDSLQLDIEEGTVPLDTSSLITPLNITLPFSASSNTTYVVVTLNDKGKWEQDDEITLAIIDSGTVMISTPHASSFQVVELADSEESEDCETNFVALALMICWIACCTTAIVISLVFNARKLKNSGEVQPESRDDQRDGNELVSAEKDKKDQVDSKSERTYPVFCSDHLVLSFIRHGARSRVFQLSELMMSVLLDLTFVGLLLLAMEPSTKETSDTYSDTGDYILLAVLAAIIGWFGTLILEVMFFTIHRVKFPWVIITGLITVICIGVVIGVSLMTITMCSNWVDIWACLFAIAVCIDLVFLQSITALIKVSIRRLIKT